MDDAGLRDQLSDMNHLITRQGWKFGPVRGRLSNTCHPDKLGASRDTPTLETASDTQCMVLKPSRGPELALSTKTNAVDALWAMLKVDQHQEKLGRLTATWRQTIAEKLQDVTPTPVDVILSDQNEGAEDHFLRFSVEADLLTPSLRQIRSRMEVLPFMPNAPGLGKVRKRQQRRLDRRGTGSRLAALWACEVLANHIARVDNPRSWADMLINALHDCNTADMMHFNDGRLLARIDIAPGVHWREDRLVLEQKLPETVLATLSGRTLGQVLEHPVLPSDRVIVSAKATQRRATITTKARSVPLSRIVEDLGARIDDGMRDRLLAALL